ncbi:universal stress protein [Sabulilitoribacter multivorans]|uniref:Universal stress protein n=1 Tax=Flaviramulus multivorans TaxID=1304750 RepID=A0ABS9IMP7_9FLAO|nr:universal stress protein [Flaviramulus multivorans]MCF7561822.1 universal stress protein [Flaviramulus multivorans]
MKTILLPTDFSKNSINAINYAVKLLEHDTCSFYVMNVQKASSFISDDLMTVSSSATIYNTLVDAAKRSISNIISQLKKKYKNKSHTFYSIVDYDNFIDAINQTCEVNSVDLIIMGTKGASGLNKILFGSNTVHVMQRCNVPVLAIPDTCKFKKIDTVAFSCSFSTSYAAQSFKILIDLVSNFKAKLKVLHVIEDYNFEEKRIENMNFFKENFIEVTVDRKPLEDKDVFKTIHDYIISNDVKIIAMLSKKHSFLERLFSKHVVETFAFKIDIPFLVLKQH